MNGDIALALAKKYTKDTVKGMGAIKGDKGDPGESAVKPYDKFVVVCIAGQSNAVGYDESPIDTNFTYANRDTNRIKQLGFYGENNLKCISYYDKINKRKKQIDLDKSHRNVLPHTHLYLWGAGCGRI